MIYFDFERYKFVVSARYYLRCIHCGKLSHSDVYTTEKICEICVENIKQIEKC